jgi:hypothetical protein
MAGPFKMKGSPMQRNFGVGPDTKGNTKFPGSGNSTPLKKDVKQNVTQGVSKNINTPGWKTTTVTTTKPGYQSHDITTLDKTGQVVSEGGDINQKQPTKPKAIKKPKPKSTVSKVTKAGKNIFKKGVKFFGGKSLGVLGMMGAGTLSATAGNVDKKSEGQQIKNLLKKHKLKGGN